MSGDAERPDPVVDARDVHVRAVWKTLASPVSIAIATEDTVVLLDGAAAAALTAADGVLEAGNLKVRGSAEQLSALADEARRAAEREYLELGEVDITQVEGRLELRRGSGDALRDADPIRVSELLEHERNGWRDRGVNYAKWTFFCDGTHFVTSPLRAAFVVEQIATAVSRSHRG